MNPHLQRFLAVLTFIVLILPLSGQTTFSWGPSVGMNLSQHYGTKGDDLDYAVQTKLRSAMTVGAYLDMKVIPNLTLSYELNYCPKGSHETITIKRMELDGQLQDLAQPAVMKVDYLLDYLELPVLFKIKVWEGKSLSAEAITGTAMAIKIKGKHHLQGKVYLPEGDEFTQLDF